MGRPREHGERVAAQVRMPVELHARLAAAAHERDVPVNTLVTKAIGRYLDQLTPIEEVLQTLEAAAGQRAV